MEGTIFMIYGFDSNKNLVGIQGRIVDFNVTTFTDISSLEVGDSIIITATNINIDDPPTISTTVTATYLIEKIATDVTDSQGFSEATSSESIPDIYCCNEYTSSNNTIRRIIYLYPILFLNSITKGFMYPTRMRWKITRIS